ncbi:hypothetical protein EJB05_13244, partial [Eragrostis curvula]
MASLLVCMSSLMLIFSICAYVFQLVTDGRRRLPPGPRPLPLIGNLLDLVNELPHRSLARLARRHGPLMTVRLGTMATVVVSSPSTARELLHTHNSILTGHNPPDAWLAHGHGANSVFVLPLGHKWRALRRVGTEHLLSTRHLNGERMRPLLRDAAVGLVHRVAAELAAAPVEVGRAVSTAAMGLQWQAMFSAGLDDTDDDDAVLLDAAREAVALSLKPNVSDLFPALAVADLQARFSSPVETFYWRSRTLPLKLTYWKISDTSFQERWPCLQGVRRRFARRVAIVYRRIDEQIERRMQARQEDGGRSSLGEKDLLDGMLDTLEQGNGGGVVTINRDMMRTFLTDIFLAAVDTISTTVEWAMAELRTTTPTHTEKVAGGAQDGSGLQDTHVEHSDVDRLPYLRAVIRETLRLHTVVPLVPNKAEETVEIHGHTVPKGCTVLVNIWAARVDAHAGGEGEWP